MSPDPKKRVILFLAYYFPPIQSIAVWRNYFLAEAMQASGNDVTVLTSSKQPKDHVLVHNKSLKIVEIPCFDYRTFRQNQESKSGFHYTEAEKKSWFRKFAIKLINSFPFNIFLGEGGLKYIYNSYQYGKKQVETGNVSHVYSSFRPMADHYIAWLLKRKYPKLHWTADFRDLPFDRIYKLYFGYAFQNWIHRKMLNSADLTTSFSQGIAHTLSVQMNQRVIHMPNGLFNANKKADEMLFTRFTISYTGSLFQEERSPDGFFKLMKEMLGNKELDPQNIQLIYAGKDGSQWMNIARKNGLESICINQGLLSQEASKSIQQRSHINLMLSSSHPDFKGVYTGKFFEYLAANRPIIAFVKGETDEELKRAFEKYSLGTIIFSDSSELNLTKKFLLQLYQTWLESGVCNYRFSDELSKDFDWKRSVEIWESEMAGG